MCCTESSLSLALPKLRAEQVSSPNVHRNTGLQRPSASAKWPTFHGPSLVTAALQPELYQSLMLTITQHPQQDSIKPWASCVISTSCTQGRECNAVFVHWRRPVSSPAPMSQPSRLGKPKNIQLCVWAWKPRRLFCGWNRSGSQLVFIKQLATLKQPPHIYLTLQQMAVPAQLNAWPKKKKKSLSEK